MNKEQSQRFTRQFAIYVLITRFPCLMAKTLLRSFWSTSIAVTIITTASNEQAKPKQHLHHIYLMAYYLREEDIVLDSIPNGIHLHHANTKATLSVTYFDASESAPPLPCCNLLSRISKGFCYKIVLNYPQDIITFNINNVLNKKKNKPNEPVATVPPPPPKKRFYHLT